MAKLDYFQDSGSNYDFGDKLISPNKRVSQFDLSYVNTLTAKQGQIIPVWMSYYYPNDEMDLSIDNLIRVVNPPVVPLLSRQRVFFHMFKLDFSQMWTYWDTFMKKGWDGKFEAVIPTLTAKLAVDGKINPLLARGSLADFLGFNFSDYTYKAGDENIDVSLPAMPFLAYQLIYRDYFLNFNVSSAYAKANPGTELDLFFPDSDYDLMLQGTNPAGLTLDGKGQAPSTQPLRKLGFGKLRYRDFSPDYFTTALPWPMRGEIPTLDGSIQFTGNIPVSPGSSPLTFNQGTFPSFSSESSSVVFYNTPLHLMFTDNSKSYNVGVSSISPTPGPSGESMTFLRSGKLSGGTLPRMSNVSDKNYVVNQSDINSVIAGLSVTQPQLKLLWTNTLIAEKMAKTDGTYGQFIRTFFGENPSHWVSHRATYLGGTYQPIVYSEVLQTSPSAEGGTLGTVGAKGISSSSNFVGRFHADDFGIAMCVMSIMPDTYYSQGWLREHLYRTQDDYPLPERALLGMQAVTNAEIFFNARDNASNEVLFGYQSRFDELRYRQNEVHGLVADNANLSFSPYVQTRDFAQAPLLNPTFLTTENNIDNEYLSAPNEVPYIVQVANRVKAVRALPYFAPPSAVMM